MARLPLQPRDTILFPPAPRRLIKRLTAPRSTPGPTRPDPPPVSPGFGGSSLRGLGPAQSPAIGVTGFANIVNRTTLYLRSRERLLLVGMQDRHKAESLLRHDTLSASLDEWCSWLSGWRCCHLCADRSQMSVDLKSYHVTKVCKDGSCSGDFPYFGLCISGKETHASCFSFLNMCRF
jgi:hypothetical protein